MKKEVALYSPSPTPHVCYSSGQIGYCLTWTEREAEWWRKGGDLIFPFRVEFRIPNSSLSWKRESKLKASRVATTRVLLCWFLFVFVKSFVLIVLPTHPPPLKMWICLYWKCSYLISPHTNFVFSLPRRSYTYIGLWPKWKFHTHSSLFSSSPIKSSKYPASHKIHIHSLPSLSSLISHPFIHSILGSSHLSFSPEPYQQYRIQFVPAVKWEPD